MERKPKYTTHKYDSQESSADYSAERLFDTEKSDSARRTSVSPSSRVSGQHSSKNVSGRKTAASSEAISRKVSASRTSGTSRTSSSSKVSASSRASAASRPSRGSGPSASSRTTGSPKASGRRSASKRNKNRNLQMIAIAAAALIIIVAVIIIIATSKIPEAKKLTIKSTNNSQILTWERNGKNISYEVYRKETEGDFSLVRTIGEEDDTSYTAESLNSATLYKYKVVAVKGKRKSKGVTIEGTTIPVIPSNLSASTQVELSLTLVWSDSQNVAGYDLKFGSANDLSDATTTTVSLDGITIDENTGLRSYTYANLEEGAVYYFSIRSFCDKDIYSDWTPITSARVTRAVNMAGIDPSAPMVAITFDDGPDSSDVTSRILDAFAKSGGHATFFQLGNLVENYPDKVQRMVDEGHEVGNHTYDHTHMKNSVTSDDIIRANDSIERVCGVRPYSFRCPGGESTDLIIDTCNSQGMSVYHWSLDTRDWSSRDANAVVSEIKNNVKDGDIILMHNIYSSTADAVEEILPWLTEQGYQLVTVSQLIQAKTGEPPIPGTTYKRSDYSW